MSQYQTVKEAREAAEYRLIKGRTPKGEVRCPKCSSCIENTNAARRSFTCKFLGGVRVGSNGTCKHGAAKPASGE